KEEPRGFKSLSDVEIARLSDKPLLALQEKGVRRSCALPYELYVDGRLSADGKSFEIEFAAGDLVFGALAAGAPFNVYAPVKYKDTEGKEEICRNWHFAVKAGDKISYSWPLAAFENGSCHLRVHGPNGFYREFKGDEKSAGVLVGADYEGSRL